MLVRRRSRGGGFGVNNANVSAVVRLPICTRPLVFYGEFVYDQSRPESNQIDRYASKRASLLAISDASVMIRSDRAMPDDLKAGPTLVSAPEFLAALERSGVLPDAKWREVRDRFTHGREPR